MISNSCPHCGAPIISDHCEYCGAVFYDFTAIDISNRRPTYIKLNLPGNGQLVSRALVNDFSLKMSCSELTEMDLSLTLT